MRDYLGNLVARSFDLAEVVQPRPVSLFELTPVRGVPTFGEPGSPETNDEPVSGQLEYEGILAQLPGHPEQHSRLSPSFVNEGRGSSGKRDHAAYSSDRKEEEAFTRELPPPQSTPMQSPHRDQAKSHYLIPLFLMQPTGESPSFEPIIRQVESEQVVLSSRPMETIIGKTKVERLSSSNKRESYPLLEPILSPPVATAFGTSFTESEGSHPNTETARSTVEREERHVLKQARSRPETLDQPAATPLVVQPRITPYDELPAQRLAKTPEATPTIHVTIGRVEVRAAPPPSPTEKIQRTRAPVKSLDEYLRERANGSQR